MKIIVEQELSKKSWKVTIANKYADSLTYEEMLGVVAAATLPDERPCLHWLKTEEEHQQWLESLKPKNNV